MFDRLEDIVIRLDEILNELQEPDVANDQNRFRKLMKEQAELTPIAEAYKEYTTCKQNIEDSLELLEEESDEEMREMFTYTMKSKYNTHLITKKKLQILWAETISKFINANLHWLLA